MNVTLLKLSVVLARTERVAIRSRSALYRLMADGRFPRPEPAPIGVAKFWRADLVEEAINKLAAMRGDGDHNDF